MAAKEHKFDVYVTSELIFELNKEVCPHCGSGETPEQLDYFGTIYHSVQGDVLKCESCKKINVIVHAPDIESDTPILTEWTVPIPEQIQKKEGGLTQ